MTSFSSIATIIRDDRNISYYATLCNYINVSFVKIQILIIWFKKKKRKRTIMLHTNTTLAIERSTAMMRSRTCIQTKIQCRWRAATSTATRWWTHWNNTVRPSAAASRILWHWYCYRVSKSRCCSITKKQIINCKLIDWLKNSYKII